MATTDKTTDAASDAELVRRIRDSDADAFRTLYFRHYDSLFRYAWYRSASMESVRDALQDVFTRLWQIRRSLDPEKSVRAYLYRILRNLLIDRLRQAPAGRTISLDAAGDAASAGGPAPDLNIDVQAAIEAMPEDLREAFMLNRHQGLKYAEIAEVCGISVKTVESRIGRALNFLRNRLRP
jgi:RNA polymerase sigma-70 factor, ECF subfamily